MNNKDLNKILKPLRDFNPQVKPNWEAFVANQGSHLTSAEKAANRTAENSNTLFTGIKYAAFVLTIVAGLFYLWFLVTDNNDTPTKLQDADKLIEAPANANSFDNNQAVIEDEPGKQPANISADRKSRPPVVNQAKEQTPKAVSGEEQIPESNTENEASTIETNENQVVIKTTDTVVIHKKFFVHDTIKIMKAFGK